MAVFEYHAMAIGREGHGESGRMVARDKIDLYDKLRRRGLKLVNCKKVEGLAAIIARLTASVEA